jgi:hypothetical protein
MGRKACLPEVSKPQAQKDGQCLWLFRMCFKHELVKSVENGMGGVETTHKTAPKTSYRDTARRIDEVDIALLGDLEVWCKGDVGPLSLFLCLARIREVA